MWWAPPSAPIAGNTRPDKATIYRPLSWIGTRNRHAVLRDIPVSIGGLDTMSQVIRSFASGLADPPVARVPPVLRAPRRKALHVNSPSDRKRTMRPSRLHANG